jgi:UDP-N-acetylmuramate--alanine ligase
MPHDDAMIGADGLRRVHFIGIGGSGMAGIAMVAHCRGIHVSGSDLKKTSYMQPLLQAGVSVALRHDAANIDDEAIELIVASTAIPDSNPELVEARRRGLPVWPRARMLAWLGRGLGVIAVCGTHGKTTTSSMLATSLHRLGADPTFIIGGVVDGFSASSHAGSGDLCVVEADESDRSFVWLKPRIAIVTNIEADHMDHYESIEDIKGAFADFLARLDEGGCIIACAESPGLVELAEASGKAVLTYGFGEAADFRCIPGDGDGFSVRHANGEALAMRLPSSPGVHNMLNATAVAAVLDILGFDRALAANAISSYTGVRRRFDLLGQANGVSVVDDYAHHPTEIAMTLAAAARSGFAAIHALFQPHRYTRTAAFMDDFARAFSDADTVTLMDVYSAGEKPMEGVDSATLLQRIKAFHPDKDVRLIAVRDDIPLQMAKLAAPGDLIITMGAGDVTALAPLILAELTAPNDAHKAGT